LSMASRHAKSTRLRIPGTGARNLTKEGLKSRKAGKREEGTSGKLIEVRSK